MSPQRSPTAAVRLMLIGYVCYLLAFQLGRGHAVCLVKDLGKKLDLAVHQIGTQFVNAAVCGPDQQVIGLRDVLNRGHPSHTKRRPYTEPSIIM